MLSMVRARRDAGFTLVELLIAIVILGVSVSVLVLAMSSLVVASQEQRGHTVSDTGARNFSEAMQQKWSFVTKATALSNTAASGAVTLTLADPTSSFQTNTLPFDILVDQEVMTVSSESSTTLTVAAGDRGAAGSTASAHTAPVMVSQDFICPRGTATDPAANNSSGYLYPDGFSQPTNATVTIGEIDYWNPTTQTFGNVSQTTCLGYFSTGNLGCPDSSTFLPECDPGLIRVKVHVATSLANLRNVATDTWVLLRRWSN